MKLYFSDAHGQLTPLSVMRSDQNSNSSMLLCMSWLPGKKMPKIESENKFLKSIKGYNSVLICQNLPICNPRTLVHNIYSHTKFEENR